MTEWHAPRPPELDEYGDEMHPAFGAISVHRTTCTPGAVLFDSDVRHGTVMTLRIGRMTRKRDLNQDWLHPTSRDLVEVEMSEAQWASFVSSVNTTGVPCTIRRTETDVNVPGLGYAPRLAHSMAETHAAAERAFSAIREAMAAVDALDSKAPAKDRRQAMANLRAVISNATPNVDFAGKQLAEHAEDVVQKARADVEAMVTSKARQLGLSDGEAAGLVALPATATVVGEVEQ